ncbi:1400_t:CDS:1, partial [Racocetra persica]
ISQVLEKLKETDSNYATKPLEISFNWNKIATGIKDIKGGIETDIDISPEHNLK